MPKKNENRTSEHQIALGVLRVCAASPQGAASIAQLKKQVPNHVILTPEDKQQSVTRPNEQVWEQIVRNIVSHASQDGNIIAEGYAEHSPNEIRITDAGRRYLKSLGF